MRIQIDLADRLPPFLAGNFRRNWFTLRKRDTKENLPDGIFASF
jgi:hypothetical protein